MPITFDVIHQALDDLERLASRLHLLLTGAHREYAMIGFKSGWMLPLMEPVFEAPEHVRRILDSQ